MKTLPVMPALMKSVVYLFIALPFLGLAGCSNEEMVVPSTTSSNAVNAVATHVGKPRAEATVTFSDPFLKVTTTGGTATIQVSRTDFVGAESSNYTKSTAPSYTKRVVSAETSIYIDLSDRPASTNRYQVSVVIDGHRTPGTTLVF